MPAPVTDTEKLIWSVLEAERPLIRFSWNVQFALSFTLYAPVWWLAKLKPNIYFYWFIVNCRKNLWWKQIEISWKIIKVTKLVT